MDSVRYWVALIGLLGTPPGIIIWFLIHPFGGFWRRLGPWVTFTVMGVVSLGIMAALWAWRTPLLSADLGTNYPLMGAGVLSACLGTLITVKRRRYLTTAILSGLPEVSAKSYPGVLLQEGIYGKLRHPRYVEVSLWVLAYALFANHLALHIVAILTPLSLLIIIPMEERELRERFGEEWDEYAARVPRFIPRREGGRW